MTAWIEMNLNNIREVMQLWKRAKVHFNLHWQEGAAGAQDLALDAYWYLLLGDTKLLAVFLLSLLTYFKWGYPPKKHIDSGN